MAGICPFFDAFFCSTFEMTTRSQTKENQTNKMAQNEMKCFEMTPLPLLLLLLKLPRSPPSFQETALGAVASQVQHLGKQNHEFWQSSRGKFFYLTNTTMKQLFLQCSRKISYKYEEENRKPPGCAWNWARCRWECVEGFSAGEGQPWKLSDV